MEEDGKMHAKDRDEVYRSLNDPTLKEYIDMRFDAMQNVVDLHRFTTQIALDKVERELSQKFDTAQTSVYVRLGDVLMAIDVRCSSLQISLDKAEIARTTRRVRRKTFRHQWKDQSAQCVIRTEVTAIHNLFYIGLGIVLAAILLFSFFMK